MVVRVRGRTGVSSVRRLAREGGDLRGRFICLSAGRAWGLRLENPTASLRSLEETSFPVWVRQGDEETWVRHTDGNLRLKAYNTDVSLVLPSGLKEGDQIRLGDNAAARANSPRL
jgi:hypothetical protein